MDAVCASATLQALLAADTATFESYELRTVLALATLLVAKWQAALKELTEDGPCASSGPVRAALVRSLYGAAGTDPMAANTALQEDHSSLYTNVPQPFLDALMRSLRPAFCIEVGSWKGGSANRIAAAVAAAAATPASAAPPCLLCIDTWLGDGGAWIDRCTGWRDGLLLERGLPQLLWQFVANVRRQHRHIILPWPCSSLTALRALQHIVLEPGVHGVPRPDFVYLDSGHEKGESLLEITRAFDLLRPGGVLAGDDLDWWAVESDLRLFVSTLAPGALVPVEQDELLRALPHLYAVSEAGYWVLDSVPRQWVLRKGGGSDFGGGGGNDGGGNGGGGGGGGGGGSDYGGSGDGDGASIDGLAALRATVEMDEYGPSGADAREYVPLHDGDRAALLLYEEGIALLERGQTTQAARRCKAAASASPSLAAHYKLEAWETIVERSLKRFAEVPPLPPVSDLGSDE